MKTLLLLFVSVALSFAQGSNTAPEQERITREVRHELVMLPYGSIFDNLEFRVNGDTVTLSGQVTQPGMRAAANKVVKRVEGVEHVVDQIEVLPLSIFDEQIRRAEYLTLAGNSQLQVYFQQTVAPVHIIVKNGNVTLIGVVGSKADYDLMAVTANHVPGIFSFTNNLEIAGGQ